MGSQEQPVETAAAQPAPTTAAPCSEEFVNTGNGCAPADAVNLPRHAVRDRPSARRTPHLA